MKIGARVKELRHANGWSQGKLADKAQVTQSTISTIENRTIHPDAVTLNKIAKALGITIDNLINHERKVNK